MSIRYRRMRLTSKVILTAHRAGRGWGVPLLPCNTAAGAYLKAEGALWLTRCEQRHCNEHTDASADHHAHVLE